MKNKVKMLSLVLSSFTIFYEKHEEKQKSTTSGTAVGITHDSEDEIFCFRNVSV